MNPVETLLNVVYGEVGYLEKNSKDNLDDKTANAGDLNYTKYARDMDSIAGFYNGGKQGIAWCDVFVDWCFAKAFGSEIGRRLLCQPLKSAGAGCNSSMNYYKQSGQFYTYPEVGDQIFFYSSSGDTKAGHTGIVVDVTSDRVYTVEGNTSNGKEVIANGGAVCKKNYLKTNSRIIGYGRPKWSIVKTKEEDDQMTEMNYLAVVTANKGKAVNLRQSPSTMSRVLKTVPLGEKVTVLAHFDDAGVWAKVEYNGTAGYMMRMYLKAEDWQSNEDEMVTITLPLSIARKITEIFEAVINVES